MSRRLTTLPVTAYTCWIMAHLRRPSTHCQTCMGNHPHEIHKPTADPSGPNERPACNPGMHTSGVSGLLANEDQTANPTIVLKKGNSKLGRSSLLATATHPGPSPANSPRSQSNRKRGQPPQIHYIQEVTSARDTSGSSMCLPFGSDNPDVHPSAKTKRRLRSRKGKTHANRHLKEAITITDIQR